MPESMDIVRKIDEDASLGPVCVCLGVCVCARVTGMRVVVNALLETRRRRRRRRGGRRRRGMSSFGIYKRA